METFKYEYFLLERKSSEEKLQFVQDNISYLFEKIKSGDFDVVKSYKTPFGGFDGIIIRGKFYEELNRNTIWFYLGSNGERYDGKAEIENSSSNKSNVYIKIGSIISSDMFYHLEDTITPIKYKDLKPEHFYKNNISSIMSLDDIVYSITEDEKTALSHELTHIYDLITHGMKDYSDKTKWHLRHGEVEAELISLYNYLIDTMNNFKSVNEFEEKYPLTTDGIKSLISNTKLGTMLRYREENVIERNKLIKRIIEIRQKIINKLKEKNNNFKEYIQEENISFKDKNGNRQYLFWVDDNIYNLDIFKQKNGKYRIDFSLGAMDYSKGSGYNGIIVLNKVSQRVAHHAKQFNLNFDDYEIFPIDEKRKRIFKRGLQNIINSIKRG